MMLRWPSTMTTSKCHQICFLLLIFVTIYGALGQDGGLGETSTQKSGEEIIVQPQQQPIQGGQQQQRNDLNELPEMREAKELRTEAERAELEAERMRELAKLEAELKAKDEAAAMEATTMVHHDGIIEMGKSAEKMATSNETSSGERSGGGEEVAPSAEIGGTAGESGMEKETGGGEMADGGGEEGMKQKGTGGEEPKTAMHNSSEIASHEEHKDTESISVTAGGPEAEREDAAVTAIQFQQEALVTTHRALSQPQGEEESASADDPFQTSSTSAPSNGDQPPENGGGEQSEHREEPQGHEMEHEVIQQTVHVHQPQNEGGGSSGGGEESAGKELAMPGMGGGHVESNSTAQPGDGGAAIQQQTAETLVSTEIGGKKEAEGETTKEEEEEKSEEESKEEEATTDVHHAITVGQNQGQQQEEEEEVAKETTTISPAAAGGILPGAQHSTVGVHPSMQGEMTTTVGSKGEKDRGEVAAGKLPEAEMHEATEMPPPSNGEAEEHSIVFPAAHLLDEHAGQTQQPPTTEESSVIAADKSVFEHGDGEKHLPEPEKAKIQLMSHEGEPKESKEEQQHSEQQKANSSMPPPMHGPMAVNEGSDGFELITKEEHGDAPQGTSEKPEEAKEMAEEEEAEVLPTPADEAAVTQQPMAGMNGDHVDSVSTATTTTTWMMAGHEHENGQMGHEGEGMEEATTMGGGPMIGQQQSEAPLEAETADTPPQRGDLPGIDETSHPMDTTTTMGAMPEMSSTPAEDKSVNEVQEPESTSEVPMAFPVPNTSMSPEQFELAKSQAHRTAFSLRLPDIEWRPEFEDIESGAAKKLREQLDADLRAALAAATGPSNALIDFQLTALRPGSVIVEGEMLTREEVADPHSVVASLEQAILAKGGMLGGNAVDTDQLMVAGQMPTGSTSANNLMAAGQQKQQQQDATNTGLIIGGAVVVGVLIVVFAIFAIVVFGLNSRRNSCGSLKLSGGRREEICMVENGKGTTGPFGANGRRLFGSNGGGGGGTGSTNNGGGGSIIPSSADAAEAGNGGVNLMSLRTTAGSNTPTLNAAAGHPNPNYGHQNGGGGGGYANGTGSGARP